MISLPLLVNRWLDNNFHLDLTRYQEHCMDQKDTNNRIHQQSALQIYKISTVDDLTRSWDDLVKTTDPSVNRHDILGRLLGCIHDGVIFLVLDGENPVGFTCACPLDNETALLLCLPTGVAG